MKSVNEPTKMMLQYLEHCREHEDGIFSDPTGHPYFINRAVAKFLNRDTDTDEFRENELRSLAQWAEMTAHSLVQNPLQEIGKLGNHTMKGSDPKAKKLSKELLKSMAIVTAVFKSWLASVDFEHVADWVLADGQKLEAEGKDPKITDDDVKQHLDEGVGGIISALKKLMSEVLDNAGKSEDKAEACDDESHKLPEKSGKPPVTPADIMKLLFEKVQNPSNN